MNKPLSAALAATLLLSGCGGGSEEAPEPQDTASLDAGTSAADMSPTLEGSGDMSSAAGAGADTAAMDGGRAGEDGAPPVAEGEGGPSDALD